MRLTEAQKKKVEKLLSQMTLNEKIGQMNQDSPSIVGGFDVSFEELIEMMTDGRIPKAEFDRLLSTAKRDYHEDDIRAGLVGSIMGNDPVKANELQKIAVEESRLGIPLIIGFDVIHGLRGVFPIAIAEAGSFDDDLMERTARMAAEESRAYGISWNFAPMLDVARDARWGASPRDPARTRILQADSPGRKSGGFRVRRIPRKPMWRRASSISWPTAPARAGGIIILRPCPFHSCIIRICPRSRRRWRRARQPLWRRSTTSTASPAR